MLIGTNVLDSTSQAFTHFFRLSVSPFFTNNAILCVTDGEMEYKPVIIKHYQERYGNTNVTTGDYIYNVSAIRTGTWTNLDGTTRIAVYDCGLPVPRIRK